MKHPDRLAAVAFQTVAQIPISSFPVNYFAILPTPALIRSDGGVKLKGYHFYLLII